MEHSNIITKLLGMKDQNITIKDIIDCQTHKEIIASLDYDAPDCSRCGGKMTKYDFQKASKIPTILNQKIAQKLIEKTSITKIAEELSVSTDSYHCNTFSKM